MFREADKPKEFKTKIFPNGFGKKRCPNCDCRFGQDLIPDAYQYYYRANVSAAIVNEEQVSKIECPKCEAFWFTKWFDASEKGKAYYFFLGFFIAAFSALIMELI